MARIGGPRGRYDLNPDVLALSLLCQVYQLPVHDVLWAYAAVQYGFIHDRDEVDRHGPTFDRLLLKVDPSRTRDIVPAAGAAALSDAS